ncbi:MAG: DUF5652 family protein [Patescibacteria group bacterium]|nr:DUF5652 family protein [Patescibacteria group bacterium]
MNQFFGEIFSRPEFSLPFFFWAIFWKGLALWKAATKRQFWWFVIILILNTLGILEIAYIFYLNRWDLDKGKTLIFLQRKFGSEKKK